MWWQHSTPISRWNTRAAETRPKGVGKKACPPLHSQMVRVLIRVPSIRVRPIEIFSISADTDNLQNRNADYLQIQIICRYGFIGRYQNYLPIFLNLQILLAGITDNICRYGVYLQIWTHICRYCRYTDMPIWKNFICYLQIYIGKLICRYYRQISLSVVL